jgi:hypothetical protein
MPAKGARPAVEVVEVVYVDYATGRPRGAPTREERGRMADRLVQAAVQAVLGPGAKAVRRREPGGGSTFARSIGETLSSWPAPSP